MVSSTAFIVCEFHLADFFTDRALQTLDHAVVGRRAEQKESDQGLRAGGNCELRTSLGNDLFYLNKRMKTSLLFLLIHMVCL